MMGTQVGNTGLQLRNPSLFITQGYLNGTFIPSSSGSTIPITCPSTGQLLSTVPSHTPSDFRAAISHAHTTFLALKHTTTEYTRSAWLRKWHSLIVENADDLAAILAMECGKTLLEAKGEVLYGASFVEWFAEEAKRSYGDVVPSRLEGGMVYTVKQGVGVVGVITPWNFPIAMITRKVAPAIAAGCTCVIKPPSETPHSALALAYLAQQAGIPRGVIHVLPTKDRSASNELCLSPLVRKISFTGSTNVGKHLAALSATPHTPDKTTNSLKRVSLELGGNAPFIIFPDANLPLALSSLLIAKFRCSGQTCVCVNRIFLHEFIHAEFLSLLTIAVQRFRCGDPFDPTITHGPLVNAAAVEKCKLHVKDALSKGAKLVFGNRAAGEIPYLKGTPQENGFFFEPTILTDMNDDMLLAHDETFGPIAGIFKFKTEEEVIARANMTEFGLAGYFFSRDADRCFRVARRLEVGMVGVNTGVISAAETPFGGVKESGLGREGSKYGLGEFQEIKAVTVRVEW